MDKISNFTIYAYGAYRRLGIGALSETRDPDPRATLFDESKTLLNVEEWILQADYAAEKSKDPKAKQRLARIIDLLSRRKLLPDVDNIQISAQGINTPIVEAHTSTGWIPLRALSSGYRALIAWVVDLASRLFDRYPESANPLAEPAVVIIDQIHTHPTTRGHKLSSL